MDDCSTVTRGRPTLGVTIKGVTVKLHINNFKMAQTRGGGHKRNSSIMSGAMKRIALDSAQGGALSSTRRASFGRVDTHDTSWLSPEDCTMNTRKNSFSQMLSRNCLTPQEPVNNMTTPSSPLPIMRSRLSSWVKESPFLLRIRKDSIQRHRDASPIYQRFPESPNRISTILSPLVHTSPIKFDLFQDDSPRPSSPLCVIKRGRSKSINWISPSGEHHKSQEINDAMIPEQSSIPFQCLSPCCENKDEGFLFHFDAEGFPLSVNKAETSLHDDDNNNDSYSNNNNNKNKVTYNNNRISERNSASITSNINKSNKRNFDDIYPHEKNLNLAYSPENLIKDYNKSMKPVEKVDKNKTSDDLDNTPTKNPKIVIESPADEKEDCDMICSPTKLMSSYSTRGFSSVLMSVTKGNNPIGTNLSYLMKSPFNPSSIKKSSLSAHRRGSLQPHLLHTPKEKAMSVSYKFPHAGVLGLVSVQRNDSGWPETLRLSLHKKRQSVCPSSLSHAQHKICVSQFQDDLGTHTLTLQDKIKAINRGFQPKIGRILGRGGFGVVKMGLCDGKFVAIKIIHGSRAATSACHEKLALNIPPHPHVVATHAFVQSTSGETAKIYWKTGKKHENKKISQEELKSWFSLPFENVCDTNLSGINRGSEWVWIVSELCTPLTLQSLINMSNLTFTLRDKIKLLGEMTSGVSHLHSLGLNHLDLKPCNALIAYDGKVKIADFGCCSPTNDHMGEPVIGTVAYQAPEVLIGGCGTNASDIFSLGVTIWHLVMGKCPYYGIHPHVILYQVTRLNQRPNSIMCFSPRPSSLLEDLLLRISERCWTRDPAARPTAQALCRSLAALYLSPAT